MPTWNPETKSWESAPPERPYIEITPPRKREPVTLGDPLGKPSNTVTLGPAITPQTQPVTLGEPESALVRYGREAIRPFTDYPEEYRRRNIEGRAAMSSGWEELTRTRNISDIITEKEPPTKISRILGGLRALGGAFEYGTAPIGAAVQTFGGGPIQAATGQLTGTKGIPHEWTNEALELIIPGFGLTTIGGRLGPPASALERIFSPDTVSPLAREAAGTIRAQSGQAARDYEQTSAAVEQYRSAVNKLPDAERLALMHYMEGQPVNIPQALRPLADTLKTAFEARRAKLERLYPTMEFIDDYFPHMWKDPAKARAFADEYAARAVGKQGSGASLKKRSVPTIAEGLARGLEPISTDPIEMSLRYVQSMDHFIASQEMLNAGKNAGHVVYIKPKVVGASGRPDSFKVPEGYVPIEGRGSVRGDGAKAYAPADWARVYNNYIGQGWHRNPDYGPVLDRMQRASNAITALELGLSGYHAYTMANEAFISQFARGLSQLFTPGQRLKAIGTIPTAFAAPATSFMRGRKGLEVYLGRTPGTPDMRRVMDLLTEAGGRAVGSRHAPEYQFSAMSNYWTAFKRGALKQELAGDKFKPGQMLGRAMSTVAHPLFNYYIPRLKTGAFYEHMKTWLDANPAATHEMQVAAARKIWDSIDNRFGEMVQDNIFWNKTLKQVSTLGMRSYSWNMGTIREIGGGALSAMRDPRRLAMTSPDYDPRVAYVMAMPMAVATMNAVYQYLMTGKAPEDVSDLMAGRTGGTAPGFGGRGQVPERVMLPGYQKDVFGWYHDWLQEATNKTARLPALAIETMRNQDWRGAPIRNLEDPGDKQLAQYLNYVADAFTPISIKTFLQGAKVGSNIGPMGQMAGERPAPPYLQDPVGYARGMSGVHRRAWRGKERYERRQRSQYGGDVQE